MSNRDSSAGEVHADDLTWREQEVLFLLSERLTNREIADRLHLAESTVKDYVGKIISKLYVKNRREAVARAEELGLLDGTRNAKSKPLTNLPPDPTPFVGRKHELDEIKCHLVETRLLTLTGPGGIGKTRLALKVAEAAVDDFEDGCFLVSLAPIRSAEHIIQSIAEALKFPLATHEDPQYQLLRYLRSRRLLLLMDNFEHLLDGVSIVNEILQIAPGVKVMATSREKLNLLAETNFIVGGMGYSRQARSEDIPQSDGIALFVQSASRVRPGFDPSENELEQIAKICESVQGMPLAIELAAAWLQILNLAEVVEELEQGLDILITEVRDAPERHRSIRAVFDYSWSLMQQGEQEIFMALSVFRGGFSREAAQQVAGASLQQLVGLVNKSFLSHDLDSGRLEVHELLRQYAQERLEKTPDVSSSAHEAHAAYYAEFMENSWGHLKGDRQMLALAEIEADIENIRGAWRYYLDQRNASQLMKLINCLWHVYWIRWWNHAGMELFAEAVKLLQGEDDEECAALRALAMAFQGYFMAWLALADQGYALAKIGVAILQQLDYPAALVLAYVSLILNTYFLNRYTEEREAADKMLAVAEELDDKWLLAYSLFAASMGALVMDDYQEAKRLATSNLKLYQELGDSIGTTMPILVLGHVALANDEYKRAKEYYLRSLKISEQVGFHYAVQTSSKYLGKVTLSLGEIKQAQYYLAKGLSISIEIGFIRDIVNLLYEFARLRSAQDDPEGAIELLALVLMQPASDQTRWREGRISDSAIDLLAKLEAELPQETYTSALERGRGLELDEIAADLVGPKRRI